MEEFITNWKAQKISEIEAEYQLRLQKLNELTDVEILHSEIAKFTHLSISHLDAEKSWVALIWLNANM